MYILSKQTNPRGFTLIELLVTIAIIAIISVVAVALFGGVQGDARDGKRRTELEAIANALEVSKDQVTGYYKVIDATKFGGGVFPGTVTGIAADPQGYPYCISYNGTGTAPSNSPLAVWGNTGTPPSCSTTAPTVGTTYVRIDGTVPPNASNVNAWKICTRLEKGGGTVECRSNVQ